MVLPGTEASHPDDPAVLVRGYEGQPLFSIGATRCRMVAVSSYLTQILSLIDYTDLSWAVRVTPHMTQHTTNRTSAIDDRTTRHIGYAIS